MAEPMLMGTSLSDDPLTALPLARRRFLEASRQIEELQSQQPDFSQAQEYARRQGDLGQTSLLNALAAQYAGEGFQPLQAKFLRQAEASQQPLRIGSTMILPTGEVVRDPNAERAQRLGALERRADVAAGDIRLLETAAERRAENARLQQERLAARQAEAERDRQSRLDLAAFAASLRQPAGGAQAQPATEIPLVSGLSIIPPNIQLSPAMGARGVFENYGSRIANLVGAGDPNAPSRETTAALDALATQTRATLTAAFPGRSSVELLKQLERHTIKPNEFFTGVASIPQKARVNIAMLEDALQRTQDSLRTVANIPPAQRSQMIQNGMRIQSLIQDYRTLSDAASRQTSTAAPQIAPRGQPAAATGGRLTPAEEQELAALRARFGKQP